MEKLKNLTISKAFPECWQKISAKFLPWSNRAVLLSRSKAPAWKFMSFVMVYH